MTETTSQPKYVQLAAQLREQILSGELKVGDRLPSYAEMYRRFGATPATAQRVCDLLEQENLIERRGGSGIYVAEQQRRVSTGLICLLWLSLTAIQGNNGIPSLNSQLLQAGIHHACREYGLKILLNDEYDVEQTAKTDGLLIGSDKLEFYAMGIPSSTPHVLIGQHADGTTSIKSDDYQGGQIAANHLIQNGHRRIACFMEGMYDETLQRIAGYQAAMTKAGLPVVPDWIKKTSKADLQAGYLAWSRRVMQKWLEEDWLSLGCTALIAQNNMCAIGAMQALEEAGIKVPDQVSVIGFDGTDVCNLTTPRLASIEIPFYQLGYEAVKALVEQIENGTHSPRNITLPVSLRTGDSVLKIN